MDTVGMKNNGFGKLKNFLVPVSIDFPEMLAGSENTYKIKIHKHFRLRKKQTLADKR